MFSSKEMLSRKMSGSIIIEIGDIVLLDLGNFLARSLLVGRFPDQNKLLQTKHCLYVIELENTHCIRQAYLDNLSFFKESSFLFIIKSKKSLAKSKA